MMSAPADDTNPAALDASRWYPVAASSDVPGRHVYQTRLAGNGLAIWRAANGALNIWEDRCPHRGLRFSVGDALDDELRCQYHGWRFASGSGACTAIPAQPRSRPAAALRAKVWPVREVDGLIWTGVAPHGEPICGPGTVLRALPVNRDAEVVQAALPLVAYCRWLLQPADAGRCVVRGISERPDRAALELLDDLLEAVRRRLEHAA